jgi:hypothetical protein
MSFVFMTMVCRPWPTNVLVCAYKRIQLESQRVIVSVFVIFFFRLRPRVVYASELHPAVGFEGLAVDETGSGVIDPGKDRVLFRLCGPFRIPIEIVEYSLLFL